MKLKSILSPITVAAVACLLAVPVFGQESERAKERALREYERQMREAEQAMREAQKELQEAARRIAELEAKEAAKEQNVHRYIYFGGRPRVGVVVQTEADPKVDAVGAKLVAVTPGGPADEAGLKPGDIVTRVDGTPVVGSYEDLDIDDDESGPAARFIELLSDLEEDQEVTFEYRRGSETHTAKVKARTLFGPDVRVFIDKERIVVPPDVVDLALPEKHELEHLDRLVDVRFNWDRDWMGMEMVALNPDLGRYFGTDEGILVVKTAKESGFDLRAGDVILEIDGRKPTHPSKVLRILSSYEPGETVGMEIMRDRQRISLNVTVPERKVVIRGPAAKPAPAAPPAPVVKPVGKEPGIEQL